MKRFLPLLILLTSPITYAATDSADAPLPPMSISTGAQGGGYWGVGTRLASAVKKHGGTIEVRSSAGSLENLRRLQAPVDPTALALTQADALAWFLQNHPGFGSEFEQLESIGRECIFVIAAGDSGIETLTDLEQGSHPLAIPGETSGVAVTFKALQSMRPGLAAARPVYMNAEQAMLELAKPAGQRNIDALMLVHRPKLRSGPLKQAIADPQRFHLVAIGDNKLDAKLPNGKPVYTPLKLPLVRDNWSTLQSLKTVCMEGLLLSAPQKLSATQAALLQRTIDLNWMQVYAEPRR